MRKFLFAAVVAVAALFSNVSNANAAFQLQYSLNGGAFVAVDDGGTGNIVVTNVGGLNILAHGSYGGSTQELTLADLAVSGQTTGPLDLVIQISANGIITAPAPQTLTYAYTGSALPAGLVTLTGQTWVGADNDLFSTAGTTVGALAVPASGSFDFNGTVPYSFTTELHFSSTSTGPISLSADLNTQLSSSPAPAGLLLGLAGMPLMGLGAYIRRRKAVKA